MSTPMSRLQRIFIVCALVFVSALQVVRAENKAQRAQLLKTRECAGCDLSDANLSPYDLNGVKAPGAVFTNAILYRSKLRGADLTSANLANANLRSADLTGAILTGANLDSADLSDTIGANLTGAITTSGTKCPNRKAGPCQ